MAAARVLELVAPARLGRSFRWLLASSWVSNLGDGLALAAAPLLVASQTSDPRLVGLAVTIQFAPWLAVSLLAGAVADRVDRRLVVVLVDSLRAVVLVLLALVIATDRVSVAIVLAALLLLGTAEVFADTASTAVVPALLHRDDLALGNARLQAGFVTVNQLAGPPIGAALFAAGAVWPFAAQAVLVGFGAVLMSRIRLPAAAPQPSAGLRRDIAEGLRWTWRHPAVRTLVLTIFIFNITFGAAWSVLVLYARDRLGMGPVGYGLLTTSSAAGGIAGTLLYGAITRRVSLGDIMRIGLIIEALTHLALALITNQALALLVFFVFGAHAFVWGTTSITVRQRVVPNHLQGRVSGVNRLGVFGGLVLGSGLGGLIAAHAGITAPFWFAFVGSAVFVVLIWRQLSHIAHDDDGPGSAASASMTSS